MPADHGLASLGLVMQLGGSLFAGYMALIAVFPIFAGLGAGSLVAFLLGAAGAVRSAFHRSAGSALLYGSPRGVFRPTYTYIGVAVAQTGLTLLLLNRGGAPPSAQANLTIALVLLAWPLTLLVLLTRPRLRGLAADDVLPVGEDLGFEGAAALMVLLGLTGALIAGFKLYSGALLPGGALGADGMLIVGVFAMLLARSILHTLAGVKGTRGIDSDGATESAARYFSFGVVSSVIAGGALLILFMSRPGVGLHPAMLLLVACAVYLLLTWPLILRRFYTERNFSALLAGAEGPSYRRAPDAGMTAVGWLLLALGVFQLSLALPAALCGQGELTHALRAFDLFDTGMGDLAGAGRSTWWSVGIGMTQVWAGLELIHMTDRHRLAATIYGAVASLVTLHLMWPGPGQLEGLASSPGLGEFGPAAGTLRIGLSLVVPVATMILANRKLMPAAQARVRPRSSDAGAE
jgi:hypothetical protein